MNKHRNILNLISILRESHSQMENIYLHGSCFDLFRLLHSVYPEAIPYTNCNHIITRIDDKYYDITGVVNPSGYFSMYDMWGKRTSRLITQMKKYEK